MTVEVPEQKKAGRGGFSRGVLTAAAVLTLASLIGLAVMEARDTARTSGLLDPGAVAPAFQIDKLGGGTIDLEAYRGKVVMLSFWATWCGPCVHELPILLRLTQEYGPRGLSFIAANRDDSPRTEKVDVALFVDRREKALAPHVGFATGQMAREYGVEALPTLYFVGRDGRIISGSRGAMSEAQLRALVEAALEH